MDSIDIIAPFHVLRGDNWHAIDLYLNLLNKVDSKSAPRLWSMRQAHPEYANGYPIHAIRPFNGEIPTANRLVILGPSVDIGNWYEHNKAEQVVLIYNELESRLLFQALNRLYRASQVITIHYATQALKDATGLPGEVVMPAFNADRFMSHLTSSRASKSFGFKIGRTSRDILLKHHFRDPALYKRLVVEGFTIEIAGGTCLSSQLVNTDNINLLPVLPQKHLPDFLSNLDCFFYRTSPSNRGEVDRVILEAMAYGLPVVVENREAYIELIDSGNNGFLFTSEEEAIDQLRSLRDIAALRTKLSSKA
ncbi:MAG TPA: glycosyltransferase [Methylophilaceae bacterium]|jgi:glycosyltransferase involved in cell wall biosynthesis